MGPEQWLYRLYSRDLDFGAILAATQASGPSVIQIRTENVLPEDAGDAVITAIRRIQRQLQRPLGIPVGVLTPKALPDGLRERVLPEAVPV